MRPHLKKFIYALFFLTLGLSSCSHPPDVEDVKYELGTFTDRIIPVDLTEAVYKGITIPTSVQLPSGHFKISFKVKGSADKKYFYKIYYQNESYKFSENRDTTTLYNPLASENFYGSWEETSIGFKPISNIEEIVSDSIRISGNPRDEKKYYGEPMENVFYTTEDIRAQAQTIRNNKEWFASIPPKAKQNGMSVEEQLVMDAKWIIRNNNGAQTANNRWKRNPRMGRYSLMIVVTTEEDLAEIPFYIQHIHLRDSLKIFSPDGDYVSPYYFFKNRINTDSFPGTKVFLDTSFITARASLNPGAGIYANGLEYPGTGAIPDTGTCGWNRELFLKAHFSQFFSTVQKNTHLNTIPLIQDVNDSSYTLEEYLGSVKKYPEQSLKKDHIRNTESACAHVRYNETEKAIEIINPGNKNLSEAYKANMGIKTRIGFTYGKITAKIKFPELINRHNVWNGLTNAFWLLFQSEEKWNERRICRTGYSAKGDNRNEAPRSPQTFYSEIDFEMVKTTRYWPQVQYGDKWASIPKEDAQRTDDIIVACTNWDMTCKDCANYTTGVKEVRYKDKVFETNRWDTWYQALTTRTAVKDDALFKSPYYYYQFEWTPEYIIWRIGPEKDKLTEVGYMDHTVTNIPNNQMIAVITQEYHLSEWWPPIPFKQEYIPFPKNDIKGKVYELTVE